MSQKRSQTLVRVLCAVFIALSLVLAFQKNTAILTLMSFSWGTVAGVLLPPYLYGLYWKGATRAGAWASLITGLGVSMISAAVLGFDAVERAQDRRMRDTGVAGGDAGVSWLTPKLKREELADGVRARGRGS